MLKKLFDLYVHLYIAEDIKNKKPRVEARRLMFLTLNIFFLTGFCISTFTQIMNILGNLLGILK
jgi:hypothetical protein